jgi:peroxiredoxin family protein
MGAAMMKGRMKKKHVDQVQQMYEEARRSGVRMVACQMSMDMMGIKPEELIDGVEVGGVATMINETDRSNAALFI